MDDPNKQPDQAATAAREAGSPERWPGVWVGREEEMAALEAAFAAPPGTWKPVAIVALQGMAGVGKTYLAERFAWLHAGQFPGGVKRLAMRVEDRPTAEGLLGELAGLLEIPAARAAQVRAALLATGTLVHIDNADDLGAANAVAQLAEALPGCALIVTGRYDLLGGGHVATTGGHATTSTHATTGAHQASVEVRRAGKWTVVPVALFDEATAMAQLEAEIDRPIAAAERASFAQLARALGYLPLALSLAAAHVRDGVSPSTFLDLLNQDHLDIDHPAALGGDRDPRRRNIARTLDLSLDLLRRHLGARAEALLTGFRALGHAPPIGVGALLGAAIADLSAMDFARVVPAATRLSLLEQIPATPPRWRMHPLVAQLVRNAASEGAAVARMTDWFVARMRKESADDPRPIGERWAEVHTETGALADCLARVPPETMRRVERAGSWYAMIAGPFATWAAFCERIWPRTTTPSRARTRSGRWARWRCTWAT